MFSVGEVAVQELRPPCGRQVCGVQPKRGNEGNGCRVGNGSGPAGHQSGRRVVAAQSEEGLDLALLREHADEAGCLVAPPTRHLNAQDPADVFGIHVVVLPPHLLPAMLQCKPKS